MEFKVIKINDNCYLEYQTEQYTPQCCLITLSDNKYMKILLYWTDIERLIHALQECIHIASQEQKQQR